MPESNHPETPDSCPPEWVENLQTAIEESYDAACTIGLADHPDDIAALIVAAVEGAGDIRVAADGIRYALVPMPEPAP